MCAPGVHLFVSRISLESRLAIQRALDAKWPPVRFHKNPAAECVDVLSILAQVWRAVPRDAFARSTERRAPRSPQCRSPGRGTA